MGLYKPRTTRKTRKRGDNKIHVGMNGDNTVTRFRPVEDGKSGMCRLAFVERTGQAVFQYRIDALTGTRAGLPSPGMTGESD